MNFVAAILAIGVSLQAFAVEPGVLRDQAIHFLQKNVIGRTQKIATEGTVNSEGQEYQVRFNAILSWRNLRRTAEGLTFDQIRDIQQANTKIDENGKAVGPTVRTDRRVVFHYALAERLTSKSMVGLATMRKNTLEDPTGVGFVTMLEISADNKELYLYESQAGFGETSLDGKNLVPVASASEATLFLDKKGKLETNETLKFYSVDVNKDFARKEIHRFNLSATEITK